MPVVSLGGASLQAGSRALVREPGLTAAQGRTLPQRRQTFTLSCRASPALLLIPEQKLGCVFQ